MSNKEPKVIGIGGIFFKTADPNKTKEWYQSKLGLPTDAYGCTFSSRNIDNPEEINYLQWSPFDQKTQYFAPSEKEFMINYRVQNIKGLVEKLRNEGVTICDEIVSYDYGKFVHILDAENNKIELWEAADEGLTETA